MHNTSNNILLARVVAALMAMVLSLVSLVCPPLSCIIDSVHDRKVLEGFNKQGVAHSVVTKKWSPEWMADIVSMPFPEWSVVPTEIEIFVFQELWVDISTISELRHLKSIVIDDVELRDQDVDSIIICSKNSPALHEVRFNNCACRDDLIQRLRSQCPRLNVVVHELREPYVAEDRDFRLHNYNASRLRSGK